MIGRTDDAHDLFDRLLALSNDVGLLSEEYDPVLKRQVGNFPQAFSHVSLVNTAFRISGQEAMAFRDAPLLSTINTLKSIRQPWHVLGAGVTADDRHVARQRRLERLRVNRLDRAAERAADKTARKKP
jgi:hypothetical protein